MNAKQAYVVEIIERERGWGPRHDGYLLFLDKEKANEWIREETKDRTGPAPDYYVSYHPDGYKDVSDEIYEQICTHGRVYREKLNLKIS